MNAPLLRPQDITLLPDAGPLITLAYANALDVLFNLAQKGWIDSASEIERAAVQAGRHFRSCASHQGDEKLHIS